MDIVEEFINGFCKAQNQSFLDSDCAYGMCSHSRECLLMAQAMEKCSRSEQ